jgi:Domain of unknown function (DUF4342)
MGRATGSVKELVHEGKVRRIVIKDCDGNIVMEVPVKVTWSAGSARSRSSDTSVPRPA